jgi:putative tricarboxylic transport membrane protein
VFWSNGLVGSITTLAFILLFWPVISKIFAGIGQRLKLLKTAN